MTAILHQHLNYMTVHGRGNREEAAMWLLMKSVEKSLIQGWQEFQCRYGVPAIADHLVGPVVKASASRAEDPGFESRLWRDFSGSSHTSDLKIGTPVAALSGVWQYRVSAGTGRPGVSTLWLGEVESWIRNSYLSVAARKLVWADPSLRYSSMLLGH